MIIIYLWDFLNPGKDTQMSAETALRSLPSNPSNSKAGGVGGFDPSFDQAQRQAKRFVEASTRNDLLEMQATYKAMR